MNLRPNQLIFREAKSILLSRLLQYYQTINAISFLSFQDINSSIDLIKSEPRSMPLAEGLQAMEKNPPRRWLAIRKKVRNMNTKALWRSLGKVKQAITTTDELIALIGASDQTALIDNIKARRLVLLVIQNDLRASTGWLSAVSGAQRCTAMYTKILGGNRDRSIPCRHIILMQLILDHFSNDCLRGLTRCRSSITTCGEYIQSYAGHNG